VFFVDSKRVKLLRYSDPVLGPRKLPNFESVTDDKLMVEAGDTFTVDTDRQTVRLHCGTNCSVDIGPQLVYVVTA